MRVTSAARDSLGDSTRINVDTAVQTFLLASKQRLIKSRTGRTGLLNIISEQVCCFPAAVLRFMHIFRMQSRQRDRFLAGTVQLTRAVMIALRSETARRVEDPLACCQDEAAPFATPGPPLIVTEIAKCAGSTRGASEDSADPYASTTDNIGSRSSHKYLSLWGAQGLLHATEGLCTDCKVRGDRWQAFR